MGCDFQIIGFQPDRDMQREAIVYRTGVRGALPNELPDDDIAKKKHVSEFLFLDQYTFLEHRWKDVLWKLTGFSPNYPGRMACGGGLCFDNAANGILCTIWPTKYANNNGNKDVWPPGVKALRKGQYLITPGKECRPPTGSAYWYIDAFILRQRFVPNLTISADYDVGLYYRIYCAVGGYERVHLLPPESLKGARTSLVDETQAIYDQWPKDRDRIRKYVENHLSSIAGLSESEKDQIPVYRLLLGDGFDETLEQIGIKTLRDFKDTRGTILADAMDFDMDVIEKLTHVLDVIKIDIAW